MKTSDASELFEEFMAKLEAAYNKVSPVLKHDPEARGTIMAAATDEMDIVLAVWREPDGVHYRIIKGADTMAERVATQTFGRVGFAVVPVFDVDDAAAAKEAYDIIKAMPAVLQ